MLVNMLKILGTKTTMVKITNYRDKKSYYMHAILHAFGN